VKYSKLFPMSSDEADKFIDSILSYGGGYSRVDPASVFPFSGVGKSLYSGSQGFMTIEKKTKDGKWEVTIES